MNAIYLDCGSGVFDTAKVMSDLRAALDTRTARVDLVEVRHAGRLLNVTAWANAVIVERLWREKQRRAGRCDYCRRLFDKGVRACAGCGAPL